MGTYRYEKYDTHTQSVYKQILKYPLPITCE